MFGINTLTIEAKVELRLIQGGPYQTGLFELHGILVYRYARTQMKFQNLYLFHIFKNAIDFAHVLYNSKSPVWYGSPCIWSLLGPRLHDVILCPQHEIASAKQEIQKVVVHFPYLHQNGSLKRNLCCYFFMCLLYMLADYWWNH